MLARAREEQGFGLVELLIAMTILAVGILAIIAAFSSGMVSLQRASRTSTASALADSQLELYRGIRYDLISLDTTAVGSADATWLNDPAYPATDTTRLVTAPCALPPLPYECDPSRIATGADSRSYRVDTYVVRASPASDDAGNAVGRDVKLVTVVVRDPDDLAKTFAREVSTFDRSTGS